MTPKQVPTSSKPQPLGHLDCLTTLWPCCISHFTSTSAQSILALMNYGPDNSSYKPYGSWGSMTLSRRVVISVMLRAESEKDFDRSELQNGVIEPLKEADLIE